MLEMKIKDGEVSVEAAGVTHMLLTEAAYGVASLIGQIASSVPDSIDHDKLMMILSSSFTRKFNMALDDRLDHKGGDLS